MAGEGRRAEQSRVLIIGVGNDFRKDDAAGLTCLRSLRREVDLDADLRESDGEGSRLIELWRCRDHVILLDSSEPGSFPGRIRRLGVFESGQLLKKLEPSSHVLGLAEAIHLSRTLGELPLDLVVYTIEAADVSMGQGLTPAVAAAIPDLVRCVAQELLEIRRRRQP